MRLLKWRGSAHERSVHAAAQIAIQLAQRHQTIGKSTSLFPDLWSNAIPIDPQDIGDRYRLYSFILPMTAVLRTENDAKIARKEGPLYWPMLHVKVDTHELRIVRVCLFTQGF